MKYKVFAYLNGQELLLKIALLSKKIRCQLPESALLDQIIAIPFKREVKDKDEFFEFLPCDSFTYAIRLADTFEIKVADSSSSEDSDNQFD